MAVIGRGSTAKIAAARGDGTVDIYDSVAGVLKLSLRSPHPIQSMTGSPDGSILFCTHLENPSVALWDIQTGVLIHTFSLTMEAKGTAISLNGRYLACGLSDGTVNIWEVTKRTRRPAFESGSSITCLCWLVPEERLMVANETSVQVRDIVTGSLLFRLDMRDPVYGAGYSQKYNQLAIATSSGSWSFITTIDAQQARFAIHTGFDDSLPASLSSKPPEGLCVAEEHRGWSLSTLRWGREPVSISRPR
jgi:WD40 repeat protein